MPNDHRRACIHLVGKDSSLTFEEFDDIITQWRQYVSENKQAWCGRREGSPRSSIVAGLGNLQRNKHATPRPVPQIATASASTRPGDGKAQEQDVRTIPTQMEVLCVTAVAKPDRRV